MTQAAEASGDALLLVPAFQCRLCETLSAVAVPRCPACGKFNCVRPVMVEPRALATRRRGAERFMQEEGSRLRRRGFRDGPDDFGERRPSSRRGGAMFDGPDDGDHEEASREPPARRLVRDDEEEDDEPPEPIGAVDSEEPNRIACGIDDVDEFFNGGIPEGNAIMLGGDAGIGKSSFALQVLTSIARSGRKCFYATGEEEKKDVAQRLRRFKGFSANVAQRLYVKKTDIFERVLDDCIDLEPHYCVLDSLPVMRSMEEPNYTEGSPKLVQMLAKTLRAFAAETGIVFLVIVHEAKDGKIAGPNRVKHWLHGATRFEQPFKEGSEEALRDPSLMKIRKLAFEGKYRGGPTDRRLYFTMDNDGLHPIDEQDLPIGLMTVQRGHAFGDLIGVLKEPLTPKPDRVARRKSPADKAIAVPKRKKAS